MSIWKKFVEIAKDRPTLSAHTDGRHFSIDLGPNWLAWILFALFIGGGLAAAFLLGG